MALVNINNMVVIIKYLAVDYIDFKGDDVVFAENFVQGNYVSYFIIH